MKKCIAGSSERRRKRSIHSRNTSDETCSTETSLAKDGWQSKEEKEGEKKKFASSTSSSSKKRREVGHMQRGRACKKSLQKCI